MKVKEILVALVLEIYLLEQPNLPQDITVQFTGKIF
jgi:hypothetical protein